MAVTNRRPPSRLFALHLASSVFPSLRIGQLILNALGDIPAERLFYMTDSELNRLLETFVTNHRTKF